MGMAITSVDPAAVMAAAQEIDAAGTLVAAAVRRHLATLKFGAATAGRSHGPAGEEVRRSLERVAAATAQWAYAAGELAGSLNTGAARYRAAEQHAGTRLR